MTDLNLENAKEHTVDGPYRVSTDQGFFSGRVSSQWFSRPDDQKFLDLDSLYEYTKASAENSWSRNIDVTDIEVQAPDTSNPENLQLLIPNQASGGDVVRDVVTHPNHWSFGQLCSLVQVPAGYMRRLPAPIAGINLQYGIQNFRQETVKAYVTENGGNELRAATGPDYGRILDHEVVNAVRRIAGNGTGDAPWKVPGVLDWRTSKYDPHAPITRESTTLFASDRDVFLFLVDDKHPIEIGKLPNGDPDLIFRGFYVWNSEVGSRSFGIATFYLRGVCQNRCLWGVEGFSEITFRHSKNAPGRFLQEARPALESFANNRTGALLKGIEAARDAIVAKDDDKRQEFLQRQGFGKRETQQIINTVIAEEDKKPSSIWDFVQGITAHARKNTHQDERLSVERKAGKLLDKVARAA